MNAKRFLDKILTYFFWFSLFVICVEAIGEDNKCKDKFNKGLDGSVWAKNRDFFQENRCRYANDNVRRVDGNLEISSVGRDQSCTAGQVISEQRQTGPVCATLKATVFPGFIANFERSIVGPPTRVYGFSLRTSNAYFYTFTDTEDLNEIEVQLGFDPSRDFRTYCIELVPGVGARLYIDSVLRSESNSTAPTTDEVTTNFVVFSPVWLEQGPSDGKSFFLISEISFNGKCSSHKDDTARVVTIVVVTVVCVLVAIAIAVACAVHFYRAAAMEARIHSKSQRALTLQKYASYRDGSHGSIMEEEVDEVKEI